MVLAALALKDKATFRLARLRPEARRVRTVKLPSSTSSTARPTHLSPRSTRAVPLVDCTTHCAAAGVAIRTKARHNRAAFRIRGRSMLMQRRSGELVDPTEVST